MTGFNQCVESADNAGFSTSPGGQFIILPCGTQESNPDYHPCDVTSLKIETSDGKMAVECDKPQIHDGSLSQKQMDLLCGDDLLFQIVSDSKSKAKGGKPKTLRLTGLTEPACHHGKHSLTTFKPGGAGGGDAQEWKMTMGQVDVTSPDQTFGESLFEQYWPFYGNTRRTYTATVESCGVPVNETDATYGVLTGRIEVYRESRYDLKISVPAKVSATAHRSTNVNLKTQDKTSKSSGSQSSGFGAAQSGSSATYVQGRPGGNDYVTTSTTRMMDGVILTETESSGTKGFDDSHGSSSFSMTRTDGWRQDKLSVSAKDKGTKVTKTTTNMVTAELTFNGDKVEVVKYLQAILQLPKTVQEFVDAFKDSVPKIGWQADVSVAVLEGSITGSWFIAPNASAEHPRIWLVERQYAIKFECTIVKIRMEIGFGLDWVAKNPLWEPPLFEVVFKAACGITFEVKAGFEVDSSTAEGFKIPLEGSSVPDISVVAQAMINGIGGDAICKIETGFKGKFELTGSFSKAPEMTGDIGFMPLKVTGTVKLGSISLSAVLVEHPKDIQPIWKGKVF